MPAPLDPVKFAAALQELGVTPAAVHAIRIAPQGQGEILLTELKATAKARYRRLAFELHPDRNGNDSEKAAKFAFLGTVYQQIEAMQWSPLPPPPQVQAQTHVRNFNPPNRAPGIRFQAVFAYPPPQGRGMNPTAVSGVRVPNGVHVVFLRPR